MKTLYQCGICNCYHPVEWDGDCRDDDNRFGDPEEYAEKLGISTLEVEEITAEEMEERELQ